MMTSRAPRPRRPFLLTLLMWTVAASCARSAAPTPKAVPDVATARVDTVLSHEVSVFEEVEPLLVAVAHATGHLSARDRSDFLARVAATRLVDSLGAWFRSETREPFVYPEVATGNVAQLAVVVRFVNFGSAEVAFISEDAATLRETRAVVRGAFLATLAPLGRAVLSVDAGRAHPNERAVPQLTLSTERSFGCLGYGIAWRIERREDTLAVHVDGVADPGAICPTAVGPAVRQHRLTGLAPGRYTLLVSAQGDTNVFALAITDTSIALATRRATFVTADERVHWRAAEGTFDLMCHPDGPGERMCDSLHAWVARQGRVSRVERDSAGVPSYPPAFTASQGYLTRTYRFGDERVLRALQACIESLRPLLVETVGTQVLLSARPGGDVGIGSLRTFGEPHAQRPPEISGATAACPR